jgi:hypothetical protein
MKITFAATVLACVVLNCAPAAAGCVVYEHRDFQGASWPLDSGESLQMGGAELGSNFRTIYYETSWNDAVSSFSVTSDCRITLWEHVGSSGGAGHKYVRSGKNVWYVGSAWNDVASWVDCTCR